MLFQHGGQGCELRRFQLRKVLPVPKHQIAAGDAPGGELFLRDLAVPPGGVDQVLHVPAVLDFPGKEGKLVEQPVEMHFLVNVGLVGLFLNDIQLFLFHFMLLSEFWA
mgnify:FL=1